MWLFNEEIYDGMTHKLDQPSSLRVDRGMALHKMIRLLTMTLAGEGYLNFMGNEFGHPEWIDFPREGNNFSYHFCRRRWDLADNKELKYYYLRQFDKWMNYYEERINWKISKQQYISLTHEDDKVIAFEQGDCLFIFNFHPTQVT